MWGGYWGLGCSGPCYCFVDEEKAKQDPSYYLKNTNAETRETLQELYKEFKGDEILAATMKAPEKKKVDKLNAVSGGGHSAEPRLPAHLMASCSGPGKGVHGGLGVHGREAARIPQSCGAPDCSEHTALGLP